MSFVRFLRVDEMVHNASAILHRRNVFLRIDLYVFTWVKKSLHHVSSAIEFFAAFISMLIWLSAMSISVFEA